MRKPFTHEQLSFDTLPIAEVKIPGNCRDSFFKLLKGLLYIYNTPKLNAAINTILSKKISRPKRATGRPGMGLWELFVLSQMRLGLNISYDRLQNMANYNLLLRSVMGVASSHFYGGKEYEYQNIYDNLGLLDAKVLEEVNVVLVAAGHQVFNKKADEPLQIKTDSFVVETNVHFPTDYNLLWDSARKCLDCITHILKKHPNMPGWRKRNDWYRDLKKLMRKLSKATASGSTNKEQRVKRAAQNYTTKARALFLKLIETKQRWPHGDYGDIALLSRLEHFMEMLFKHIDLVDRRLLKGEVIPHSEKLFSIFEPHTEWIRKGKSRPEVELGKKLLISTDQYHFIVDYKIMEHQADCHAAIAVADQLLNKYTLGSISFDKGFWSLENKELLSIYIPKVVLPKKGKLNGQEKETENSSWFKKLRNAHSAVESNINELEHRGLNRCPDKGYRNFATYIGLGICAYNLHKIGNRLLKQEKAAQKKAAAPPRKLAA